MGLTQTRQIKIRLADGKEIIVNDDAQISQETTVTTTCDNPKCPGKDGNGPTTIKWIQEAAAVDPAAVPDDAWRLIHVQGFAEDKPKQYCCERCLRDARRDYVPPLSPREQARIDQACASVMKPIPLPASSEAVKFAETIESAV